MLDADPTNMHSRIDADQDEPAHIRPWRHQHVEAYEAAKPWILNSADLVINTAIHDAATAAGYVDDLLGRVQ